MIRVSEMTTYYRNGTNYLASFFYDLAFFRVLVSSFLFVVGVVGGSVFVMWFFFSRCEGLNEVFSYE